MEYKKQTTFTFETLFDGEESMAGGKNLKDLKEMIAEEKELKEDEFFLTVRHDESERPLKTQKVFETYVEHVGHCKTHTLVVNLIKNPKTMKTEELKQKEPDVLPFPDVSEYTLETSTTYIIEKFLPYLESLRKAGHLKEGS